MVVNRKRPMVPAPISRTASSQPSPTKRRAKVLDTPQVIRDDTRLNGGKHATSHLLLNPKPDKRRKSKSLIDYLILYFLSAFICYSFFVCRPNPLFSSTQPQPPLCRALATYRTHVLEPYVLPPIKQSLQYAHKISEPYVEEAQSQLSPYLKPVFNIISPHAKPFIHTTKSIWDTSATFYKQSLKPYYQNAVVPRYKRHIKPFVVPVQNEVERLFTDYVSNPVRTQAIFFLHKLHLFYALQVDPFVRVLKPKIHRTARTSAANISVFCRHPLLSTFREAVTSTFFIIRKYFFISTDGLYTYVKWAAKVVGAYRRQYVDQHVDRILEQVADPKVSGNVKEAGSNPPAVIDTITNHPDASPQDTVIVNTPANVASPTSTELISSPSIAISQEGVSVSLQRSDDSHNTPTLIESLVGAGLGVAAIELQDVLVDLTLNASPNELPASTIVTQPIPESTTESESDPDIDEFLREIGAGIHSAPHDETQDETQDDDVASEPVPQKTEEERLAEIAAKRADIVGRHDKWFEKLFVKVKESGDGLVASLQSLREVGADEIRRLAPGVSGQEPVDARSLIWVQQEGEKLIKGLEGFLRKAEGRCEAWKILEGAPNDEDKKRKQETASKEKENFSDIISKVESKFSARVDTTRAEVHKLYVDLKEREVEEVLRVSGAIKDLALQAQQDIALDYAWLDDVTYRDWQRYHELLKVSDGFEVTAQQIANGTSTDPSPPSDPVTEALNGLDNDLQDIITGFNYAVSELRSHGLKIFNTRPLNSEDDSDDDGFFVVEDNERRVVDLRGVDLGNVELKKDPVGILPVKQGADEAVKILPVPDSQLPEKTEGGIDVSQVIIGKDKIQVEEALKDIPLEPRAQRHEEL